MERAEAQISAPQARFESQHNAASYWAPGVNASRFDMGSPANAQEHLPALSLTDGDKVLVADQPVTPRFKLGATENRFAEYADQQGEVPFGGRVEVSEPSSKSRSSSYYSISVGIEGNKNGNVHQQVLNVNIGDAMKVGNSKLADGQPHRGIYPIVSENGSPTHWNWVDATVKVVGGAAQLDIHRISPNEQKPVKDEQWDDVNIRYALRHQRYPQHVNADEYWHNMTERHDPRYESDSYKTAAKGQWIKLTEKAR